MSAPSFVVAGTQKAATTWLYECLHEHPQVLVPPTKELHFFCPESECGKSRHGLGLDWYLSQFPDDARFKAKGELSIDYMDYPQVPRQLYELNPSLRVLFILRDPVDRAYSAYWMSRRNHTVFPPFSDYIDPETELVARGYYHRQLRRYLDVFPADQLKILIYEDLASDPHRILAEVFDFIGVDPEFRPASAKQVIAETKSLQPRTSRLLYRYLSRFQRFPGALWTWRRVKRLTGVKQAAANGARQPKYPALPEQQAARLRSIYREETEKLFQLLGRRVPQWRV